MSDFEVELGFCAVVSDGLPLCSQRIVKSVRRIIQDDSCGRSEKPAHSVCCLDQVAHAALKLNLQTIEQNILQK